MKVSVVIPLYNKSATILRALQSVRSQSYKAYEIIIIDDGSNDGGDQLVKGFDDVTYIKQSNGGVSAARNKGIDVSNGDYVAFLDADDWWYPFHLENLIKLVSLFPGLSIYASNFHYVSGLNVIKRPALQWNDSDDERYVYWSDLCDQYKEFGLLLNSNSILIPREALKQQRFFVGLSSGEDLLLWIQLANIGGIGYSKVPSSAYLESNTFDTTGKLTVRKPCVPDIVANELASMDLKFVKKDSLNSFIAFWYRLRAVSWLELGESKFALQEMYRATKIDGFKTKDLLTSILAFLPRRMVVHLLDLRRRLIR